MAQNYEVGNIELNIKSTATESLKAFDDVIQKVTELTDKLNDVTGGLKKVGDESKSVANSVKEPTREMKKLDDSVKNVGKSAETSGDSLRKAVTFGGALIIAKKAMDMIGSGIDSSAQLIQNYRLLEISSKGYFDQALDFQSKMQGAFGVDPSESMGLQGYFATLTGSLGIAEKEVDVMSQTLTQLSYDLGSLFGEGADSMGEKIKGAIIGQTKPLRTLGIDVTQQTIQGYLDNMGLDVLVQDLNQAEKVLLRYIAILDQSQLAHGNLAHSIEMPSQQIQVLKAQIRELGMWLYNVFMGTIGKILPYINAFVMALKEMVKALAMLMGFDLGNYAMGSSSVDGGFKPAIGGANNLGNSIKDVGKKADKTKKKVKDMLGLLGFNEIHNVQQPNEPSAPVGSGGVGGGGGAGGGLGDMGGGVYDALLAKLGTYDNLMGKVQMKAKDIRNKLLDWLGFLYDINAETGELENLKWGGWKEMATSAKLLAVAIGAIMAFKFLVWAKKVMDLFLGSKAIGWLVTFIATAKEGGILVGIWTGIKTAFAKVLPVLAFIAGAVLTVKGAFDSWKFAKIIGETGELEDGLFGASKGIAEMIAGGALLGSIIPGVGTAVGALIGGLAGVTIAVAGWGFAKPIKDVDNFKDVTSETVKKMKPFEDSFKSLDKVLLELNWTDSLVTEEDVTTIAGHLETMGNYLNSEIVAKAEETKQKLQDGDIFSSLNPNEKGKLIKQIDEASVASQAETDKMTSSINKIIQKASDEKREITDDEMEIINGYQDEMYEHGVKTLSASQKDQETILINLKNNSTKISAEQASEMVKDAKRTKKDIVKEAEDRFADEIRIADDLKERGVIGEKQHKEMVENAKTFRDGEKEKANNYHDDIIREAKEHSGEYIGHIDWETGEIKNKFGIMWSSLVTNVKKFGKDFAKGFNDIKDTVKNWFKDNIKPWMTKEKWDGLWNDALKGLKSGWATVKTWFTDKVKFPSLKMPSVEWPQIKVPKFEMKGKFSMNPPSIPSIGMNWNSFKDGGFPDGENGAFFANDSEMIGKFTNGKTAVANNDQIVKGIQQGVKIGVIEAMENSMSRSEGNTNVYLDSRLIAKHQKKRELELEMTRG